MNIDLDELLSALGYRESELCEFKVNNTNPELIGKSIAALSNSARLHQTDKAYLFFGINDSGKIVGTNFKLDKRHKNQEVKNWLATQLEPATSFEVDSIQISGKKVVVFSIHPASNYPVRFRGQDYIRVGSYTKPLKDHPDLEKTLWQRLGQTVFEAAIALSNLNKEEVLDKLDYKKYFQLRNINVGSNSDSILERLRSEKLIKQMKGKYSVTNLGALLMAKDMSDFESLRRRLPRLIIYSSNNRLSAINDITVNEGYISCIPKTLEYLFNSLPNNEEIKHVFREERRLYPEVALRESLVNALIHQDFNASGVYPMIEVFRDRIEIRNPGKPLISTDRFLDDVKSRNEQLVQQMRLLNLCEERGSGIDRIVLACEVYQLPAPLIIADKSSTQITLYSPQKFQQMTKADKVRACYLHACLKFVNNEFMTNQSLRGRLKIDSKNSAYASRIIGEALKAQLIKPRFETQSGPMRSYVPYWAVRP